VTCPNDNAWLVLLVNEIYANLPGSTNVDACFPILTFSIPTMKNILNEYRYQKQYIQGINNVRNKNSEIV